MAILNFAAMAQSVVNVKPSPQHSERQDLEFGVIIHFGTNTFLDREWGDGKAMSEVFAPTELDPHQWMPAINSERQFANAMARTDCRRIHRKVSTEVAFDGDPATLWSAPVGSHHAVLEGDFAKPVTLDRILIMEWLNDGQRLERYRIEAWTPKIRRDGSKVTRSGTNESIALPGDGVSCPLEYESSGEAHIRKFQVFRDPVK